MKFDDSGRLMLLLLEKVSPPLLVMLVGKVMFALMGRITGVGVVSEALSKTLMYRVELPELKREWSTVRGK